MAGPLHNVRDISQIAYRFKASKVLFAALDLDLFGLLAAAPKTSDQLAGDTGVLRERLDILLTACVGLGLLVKQGNTYANAPASQSYLVRSAPSYFGDYYRFQIDRQVYPAFERLPDALRGRRAEFYRLMDDPQEALSFSRGQHSGSLGPAVVLARTVDLKGARRLLDVGGGSGAFSITLCRRFPELRATILDFPSPSGGDSRIRPRGRDERAHRLHSGQRVDHRMACGPGRRPAVVPSQRGLLDGRGSAIGARVCGPDTG